MTGEIFEIASALLTLTAMEVVLGIDNVIFIAILADKLPKEKQPHARRIGLLAAMILRIAMLLGISLILHAENALFALFEHEFTIRDLILIAGGGFLIAKATTEIHGKLEGEEHEQSVKKAHASLAAVITQIALMDIIFSIDSVLTAVGMVDKDKVWVMVVAIVIAVIVMMLFAGPVSRFVEHHPTVKMLALSFLLLIGVVLVMDGLGQHVGKGYIYSAMGFSLFVELLNLKARKLRKPVQLRHTHLPSDEPRP